MYRGPRHGLIKPYGPLALDPNHPWTRYVRGAWFMQDGAGSPAISDISGYKNNATLTNSPSIITGGYGQEIKLVRASSQCALVASPNRLNVDSDKNITILARVKSTGSSGSAQAIICKQFDGTNNLPWMLNINAGVSTENGMAVYTTGWSASNVSTDVRADGKYHIIGGTCALNPGGGNTTLSYFVDGMLDSRNTSGKVPGTNNNQVQIGTYSNSSWYFDGSIEFVIVLIGVALTSQEMQDFALAPYQMLQGVRTNQNIPVLSDITLALTGNSSTSSVGTLGVEFDLAQTGNSSTSSVGTPTPTQGLSGVSSATAINAPGVEFDLSLSGNSSASSVGDTTPTQGLSGVSSATAVNTPGVEFDLAQSGNVSTSQVGNAACSDTISGQADALGNASTGTPGTVTPALSIPLTGVSSATAVGDVTPAQGLTGVSSATAVGSVTVQSSDITLALTGVASTAAIGTVAYGAALPTTGVSSATGLGSTGVGIALGVSGNASTASAGTIVSGTSLAAQGIAATGMVGSASAAFQLWLANVVAASAINGITPTQGLTGSASIAATGGLGVQYASALTGTGAVGFTGTLGTAPVSTGRHQVFVVQLPVAVDVVLAPQSRMFTVFGDSVVSIQRQDAVQTIVT